MALSSEAIAKVDELLLTAVGEIIADDPDLKAVPHKVVMVYQFLMEDGRERVNVYAVSGVWTMESVGFLEFGKAILLEDNDD